MRNLTYLVMLFIVMSCSSDPDGSAIQEASFLQKVARPQYITMAEAQVLIDEAVKNALATDPLVIDANVNFTKGIISDFGTDLGNIEFTNIYYSRRETAKDPYSGIRFKEEINDRDWQIQVSNEVASRGSAIWLDGNPDQSNATIDAWGQGSSSKLWINSHWIMFNQQYGIYNFPEIKTFTTNDEAKAYFTSKNWSRIGSIYRTPDGTVKVTY